MRGNFIGMTQQELNQTVGSYQNMNGNQRPSGSYYERPQSSLTNQNQIGRGRQHTVQSDGEGKDVFEGIKNVLGNIERLKVSQNLH